MVFLKFLLTVFLIIACASSLKPLFDLDDEVFYLNNWFESRDALPTFREDYAATLTAVMSFLANNSDTYNLEDSYLNISQLVTKYGYRFEQHEVITEDGYILTLHRIPNEGAPVVFAWHGIMQSSLDYVVAGPGGSTAFYLADRGYDVWLGNARGNMFSKMNIHIPPQMPKFWDFSWHEIGYYDLPASIDYVLALTGQRMLNYVGYSQGTTSFFVCCSLRPEYNEKINVMVALAPVAWISHLFSPMFRYLFQIKIFRFLMSIGINNILQGFELAYIFCNNNNLFKFICMNLMYTGYGYGRDQFNLTNFPVVVSHMFAGSSAMQFEHYGQNIYSGRFAQFDFGPDENLKRYGTEEPPSYPVQRVSAPVALSYSFSDFYSSVVDVLHLRENLPNVIALFEARHFSHVDYCYARDLDELVNSRIVQYIEEITNQPLLGNESK